MSEYMISVYNDTEETWTLVAETQLIRTEEHHEIEYCNRIGESVLKPGEKRFFPDCKVEYGSITGAIFLQYGEADYSSCREENRTGCSTNANQGHLYATFDDSSHLSEFKIRPFGYDAAELVSHDQICARCQIPGKVDRDILRKAEEGERERERRRYHAQAETRAQQRIGTEKLLVMQEDIRKYHETLNLLIRPGTMTRNHNFSEDTKLRGLVNRSARCLIEQADGMTRATDSDVKKVEMALLSKYLSFSDVLDLLETFLYFNLTTNVVGDEELQITLTNGSKTENLLVPFILCKVSLNMLSSNVAYSVHIFKQCLKIVYDLKADTQVEDLGLLVYNDQCTPILALQLANLCSSIPSETAFDVLHVLKTYKFTQYHIAEIIARYQVSPSQIRSLAGDLKKKSTAENDKSIPAVIKEMQASGFPPAVLQKIKSTLDGASAFREGNDIDATSASKRCKTLALSLKQELSEPPCAILSELIWYLSVVVEHCRGYYPRTIQLAALANLLLAKRLESSFLLEVSTGEGKSTVIAMLASILAMCGIAVDIITSSEVLASRDADEWKKFYSFFNLKCASIPPAGLQKCETREEIDNCYSSVYSVDIVYGTVNDFAGDTLRQEFLKYNTKGSRGFQVVIVDEVDYPTLDYGLQWTYLSHKTTGLWHADQLLAMVWQLCSIFRPFRDQESGKTFWSSSPFLDFQTTMPILVASKTTIHKVGFENTVSETDKSIRKCAQKHMMQQRSTHDQSIDLSSFNSSDLLIVCNQVLDTMNISEVFDIYIMGEDGGIIKCMDGEAGEDTKQKILLTDNGKYCTIQDRELLISETLSILEKTIKFFDEFRGHSSSNEVEKRNTLIVPTFLKAYVSNRLPVFIQHAFRAMQMSRGREYLIVESPDDSRKQQKIVPIDFTASGVLEMNKKWPNGLQQFLEMKHGLPISRMSTITNFMSNFRLFKRYLKKGYIFGVTGTLGDNVDRAYLRKNFWPNAIQSQPIDRANY